MQTSLYALAVTAGTAGVLHTAAGPDHYLPFVMLAKANRWGWPKLVSVTLLCGLGHVLSSVVIGLVAVAGLAALPQIEWLQGHRGALAAYLLLGIGLAYFLWGLRQARKGHRHTHAHVHVNGSAHVHEHNHRTAHAHVHTPPSRNVFWWLFIIFVLGPCESLIPMVMAGYALGSFGGVVLISTVFSLLTLGTMLGIVVVVSAGLGQLRAAWLERYAHATAGAVIASCAGAILLLGL